MDIDSPYILQSYNIMHTHLMGGESIYNDDQVKVKGQLYPMYASENYVRKKDRKMGFSKQ